MVDERRLHVCDEALWTLSNDDLRSTVRARKNECGYTGNFARMSQSELVGLLQGLGPGEKAKKPAPKRKKYPKQQRLPLGEITNGAAPGSPIPPSTPVVTSEQRRVPLGELTNDVAPGSPIPPSTPVVTPVVTPSTRQFTEDDVAFLNQARRDHGRRDYLRKKLLKNGTVKEGDPTYEIEAMVSFCMGDIEVDDEGEASRTPMAAGCGRNQRLDKLVIFVSKVPSSSSSSSSSSMMLKLLLLLQ
jgi:hypothetical protein